MRRAILSLLLLAVVAAGAPAIEAGGQQPAQPAQAAQPGQAAPATDKVELTAGRSTVLTTDFEITRIAVTNPAVADATVVQTARDPHRRQGGRHRQPHRLGRDGAAAVRPRGGTERHRHPATAADALPGRRRPGDGQRRGPDSFRQGVEQHHLAPHGGNRGRHVEQGEGDQPAPVPRRERKPAGAAAGAVRRSEPDGIEGAWRLVLYRHRQQQRRPYYRRDRGSQRHRRPTRARRSATS